MLEQLERIRVLHARDGAAKLRQGFYIFHTVRFWCDSRVSFVRGPIIYIISYISM